MPFMQDGSYEPWRLGHPFNNIPDLAGKTDLEKHLFWIDQDLAFLANKEGDHQRQITQNQQDLQAQIDSIKTQGGFA